MEEKPPKQDESSEPQVKRRGVPVSEVKKAKRINRIGRRPCCP
jgi:hypothetical protein